jgi:hypothetical protein
VIHPNVCAQPDAKNCYVGIYFTTIFVLLGLMFSMVDWSFAILLVLRGLPGGGVVKPAIAAG